MGNEFKKLYSLDVNEWVEKKNGLSYLSWANAWGEFKKVYPDAIYEIIKDETGKCYFGDESVGYMCYTRVQAGGLTHEMWLPVMDGANKSMKIEPYTYKVKTYEKTVAGMTMFDVNKTIMRCLVKNLAMFGLGLYIYSGEDLPEDLFEKERLEKVSLVINEIKKCFQDKINNGVNKNDMYAEVSKIAGKPNFTLVKDLDIANKILEKINSMEVKEETTQKSTEENSDK